MIPKSEKRFIRLNFITIIFTLLLILAGGIVRSSGSGMGCPDWPKCFDQYVPPTHSSQLPLDYKEKYVSQRVAKNERFAKTLDKLGKGDLADRIRQDVSIMQPESFNAAKTWTEYVNRLMGAITGFLLVGLTVYSFIYKKTAKRIIILSFVNLLLVGFQAWLGSIVVSTNLLAWTVTVHMLLALVILAILVYTYNYALQLNKDTTVIIAEVIWLRVLIVASLILTILQITWGTEVRESIDFIAKSLQFNNRQSWVQQVGDVFNYHRDLAVLVAIINVIIYKIVTDKFGGKATALLVGNSIVIVLLVQITTGIILANFALPPYAQALHILFSCVLFTLQYYLFLLVYRTNTYQQ